MLIWFSSSSSRRSRKNSPRCKRLKYHSRLSRISFLLMRRGMGQKESTLESRLTSAPLKGILERLIIVEDCSMICTFSDVVFLFLNRRQLCFCRWWNASCVRASDGRSFVRETCTLPESLLVTLDVTSLYTNIPHEEGLHACKEALDTREVLDPPTDDIFNLI